MNWETILPPTANPETTRIQIMKTKKLQSSIFNVDDLFYPDKFKVDNLKNIIEQAFTKIADDISNDESHPQKPPNKPSTKLTYVNTLIKFFNSVKMEVQYLQQLLDYRSELILNISKIEALDYSDIEPILNQLLNKLKVFPAIKILVAIIFYSDLKSNLLNIKLNDIIKTRLDDPESENYINTKENIWFVNGIQYIVPTALIDVINNYNPGFDTMLVNQSGKHYINSSSLSNRFKKYTGYTFKQVQIAKRCFMDDNSTTNSE